MNIIITTNKNRGSKVIRQFSDTNLAETSTIEEAKDSLFLKQQIITTISTASTKKLKEYKLFTKWLAKLFGGSEKNLSFFPLYGEWGGGGGPKYKNGKI